MNRHNILLSENQFGFRKGKSTEDAINLLTDQIVNRIEAKNKVVGVIIDLTKAFNTVSVPILVGRLEAIAIRGYTLSIFKDYRCGRGKKMASKQNKFIQKFPSFSNKQRTCEVVPRVNALNFGLACVDNFIDSVFLLIFLWYLLL